MKSKHFNVIPTVTVQNKCTVRDLQKIAVCYSKIYTHLNKSQQDVCQQGNANNPNQTSTSHIRLYAFYNQVMPVRIFMKFGINVMPYETAPN
jgi:hypothetical protein